MSEKMKIAVAGTGYVGLSLAVLLSQHNEVRALDIVSEKVEKINAFQSPIQDDEIELFLAEAKAGTRKLYLHATVDVAEAYTGADFAIVATPTNYDSDRNFFDTSSVEAAISAIRSVNPTAWIVIKSTIPVGYTSSLRETLGDSRIIFSPEFLRESKALYDNLHPSRIVVGAPKDDEEAVKAAKTFAGLLAQGVGPAERDDQVAAAQAVRGQKVQQRRVGGERLAVLTAGIRKRHGAKARARERRREPRGIQPRHGLPRDDGRCAARAEYLCDLRAGIIEQARLHEHIIIARGGHMDGRHRPSTSSLRRRPSSSRRVSAGRSSCTIASRYSPRCAMNMSSSWSRLSLFSRKSSAHISGLSHATRVISL